MSFARTFLAALAAGLVALALACATHGLSPSLINPDEGGHYVNALFLGDWLRAGAPLSMAHAEDYYAHYPRLSIGHWPPGWYLAEAPAFALLRPSPLAALTASAFIAGLPAIVILWGLAREGAPRLGVALAAVYLLLPTVVDAARHILVDQPATLVIGLAAIAWHAATERPTLWRFLVFAALAAFAPLVKGNGALVALVPALDILFNNRWYLLRRPGLWIAALAAIAVVAPWYWISFRISAGGFNHAPGLAYAAEALVFNLAAIRDNIGIPGLLLATLGLAANRRSEIARLAAAVILATLLFQSAVPVALEPRYVAPLLPWTVILIGLGLSILWHWRVWTRPIAALIAAATLISAGLALASLPPKTDIGAPALAAAMAGRGGIWLVDGRAGGEGALIAAAAHADSGKRVWVARASQWLSSSDFMGRGYQLTARTPREARAVLDKLGATGVVIIAERDRPAYPHSALLAEAVNHSAYTLRRVPFATGAGHVLIATRNAPVRPQPELLGRGGNSANAAKLQETLR